MSDPAQQPGAGTPAPETPAAKPPEAAKPAEAGASNIEPENPAWLPDRLKKAEAKGREHIFKTAGVSSEDDLVAKLKRLQELETASLSESEKTQKRIEELTAIAGQHDSLKKSFEAVVTSEFSKLTDKQQEAIDAKAAGDAQKRWEYMEFLKSTGALEAQSTPAAPKPATTTAPGATPPPATPKNPQTPREKYEALKQTDPLQAELYRSMHARAIETSPS